MLDKLNLFGMPLQRWSGLMRMSSQRNVDELCELLDDVQLATGLDAEGAPGSAGQSAAHAHPTAKGVQSLDAYDAEWHISMVATTDRCPYICRAA